LGDPSLELAYVSEGRIEAFVDDLGRPIPQPRPTTGRAVTPMIVAGRHIGYISHDNAVLDEPGLVGLVSAAAALAKSKSSMQAAVRARVAEVDASRQRLIEASDRQRARLERRLQTGVARRLDRVADLLAQANLDDSDSMGSARALQADLDRARLELADLARGIHPATLTDDGLTAALGELVHRTPLPIQLTIDIERADPATESTIYFVCSEAVANAAKHASPSRISIDLRETGESFRLLISDDGRGGAKSGSHGGLRGLADRVDAMGGQYHLLSEAGRGTTLRVELPRRTYATSRWSADSAAAAAAVGPS
jgi:signal transduction histidine kinase